MSHGTYNGGELDADRFGSNGKRLLVDRAARIIERLDERIERQTLKPHADEVHLTAIIGALHRWLGRLEHELESPRKPLHTVQSVARELRLVRGGLWNHELIRALRATRALEHK